MGRRSDPACVKNEPLPPKNIDIPCSEHNHEFMPSNVLIWGTACKQPCKVLVDTGAAINFAIQTSGKIESIKTADGSKVPVIGAVSFPLLLGDSEYSCKATIVTGLAYSVVLGRDFLHNNGAVIDVKGYFVTFTGSNVVEFLKGHRPLVFSDITTITSYVIGAKSETLIPARLEKFLPEPIVGLIEATTRPSDSYQLHVAASLSLPDSAGMVSLRLPNPTDAPALLHKGTSVGLFSEMAPDDTVSSLEPTDCKAVYNAKGLVTRIVKRRCCLNLNVCQAIPFLRWKAAS